MTGARRGLLLCAVFAILTVGAARAAEETSSIAGLDVTIWRPDRPERTALPIIVFSHGFHGCATQSRFLMTAFAAAGYLVVAPNHADATCHGGHARWIDRPEESFGKPSTWNEASFRDRADDIRQLIAALKDDATWRDHIDWRRLGLAGHSLGGYTVLGLGGAWPGWRLDGVKAILALSPYVQPFLVHHTMSGLAAPVMYQGGTIDFGITPFLSGPMGAYDLSPAPKYFVDLKWAGHFAWTDLSRVDHDAIVAYSVAFMGRHVLGETAVPLLTNARSAVATLLYAVEPGR